MCPKRLPGPTISNVPAAVLREAAQSKVGEFWVEPVSIAKASRLAGFMANISLASPNLDELRAMVETIGATWPIVNAESLLEVERTLPAAVEPLFAQGIRHLLVSCGSLGAVLCSATAQPMGTTSTEQFSFPDIGPELANGANICSSIGANDKQT